MIRSSRTHLERGRSEACGSRCGFSNSVCAGCHSGKLALAPRLRNKTLTDIGVAMWNHAPKMAQNPARLELEDKSCKSCHGGDGTPNANIAKMMKVEMRDLRSAEVQALSDSDLKKIITEGKGKMKAAKAVTGDSVDNVVAYVRSLKK